MNYLSKGVTYSILAPVKKNVFVGGTSSVLLTIKNNLSGEVKSFYPKNLRPGHFQERYDIYIGEPESLPDVIDLDYGEYDFIFSMDYTILNKTKVTVKDESILEELEKKITD